MIRPSKLNPGVPWYITTILLGSLTIVLFGNLHIVSSRDDGFQVVPKYSFSLSETFINLDALTGMPSVEARSRYPLAVKSLQEAGLLQSEEDRARDLEAKIEADMQKRINDIIGKWFWRDYFI